MAKLDRARARGVKLGRPRVHVPLAIAGPLRDSGMSIRELARELKLSPATLHRALAARPRPKNGAPAEAPQRARTKRAARPSR